MFPMSMVQTFGRICDRLVSPNESQNCTALRPRKQLLRAGRVEASRIKLHE
jgi:hypothetical protein